MAGTPPHGGKRGKVPKGPKAQPGAKGKGASSSRKVPKAHGINPSAPQYGIQQGSSKSRTPAGLKPSRNTPSAQGNLTSKAKRQVG